MTIVTKWTAIWHNGVNVLAETDTERHARTGLSSNDMADQAAQAVQKTPNRVTLDSIRKKMARTEIFHPQIAPHMTIAIIELENGFFLVGKTTPADPANYNEELGVKFAIEDAERQAWPLEAYLLREGMWLHETTQSGWDPDAPVPTTAEAAGQPADPQAAGEDPVG